MRRRRPGRAAVRSGGVPAPADATTVPESSGVAVGTGACGSSLGSMLRLLLFRAQDAERGLRFEKPARPGKPARRHYRRREIRRRLDDTLFVEGCLTWQS